MKAQDKETSPFHEGERAFQSRVGMREKMESMGRRVIRPFMPEQHRAFFHKLPFVIVGSVDAQGAPWASALFGAPGFIASRDDRSLQIFASPTPQDPLSQALTIGAPLGLLGIELGSRRRNRVNGRVRGRDPQCIDFAVDQSFGNCPQYIQTRAFEPRALPEAPAVERLEQLDDAARALILAADTFFVSSYIETKEDASIEGVDVSHRGGKPGFIKVEANTLTIPDYSGNHHFNTLGNFLLNPKAGLLFLDFNTGDLLQLSGSVELLDEDHPEVRDFTGAERGWRFTFQRGHRFLAAMPLRWTFGQFSPNTLLTGDWDEAKRRDWQDFRVVKVKDESAVIRSFYLEPADGAEAPSFRPGQHLTLSAQPEGESAPLIRNYTVSSAPSDPLYRISVKRDGRISGHLHGVVRPGDTVKAKAPRGDFFLDTSARRPAVLLAAGVGITPMISMARHSGHGRPLTIIHSSKDSRQRAFFEELSELAEENDHIRYYSVLSATEDGEVQGVDYHYQGRLDEGMLKDILAFDDYDFYLCGPPVYMQELYELLVRLGARDQQIFAESFGPASLKRAGASHDDESEAALVRFKRSGFLQRWNRGDGTLLETAEAHGLSPDFSCRSGSCGSCAVALKAGRVHYRKTPTADRAKGEVLICCAVPARGCDLIELDL